MLIIPGWYSVSVVICQCIGSRLSVSLYENDDGYFRFRKWENPVFFSFFFPSRDYLGSGYLFFFTCFMVCIYERWGRIMLREREVAVRIYFLFLLCHLVLLFFRLHDFLQEGHRRCRLASPWWRQGSRSHVVIEGKLIASHVAQVSAGGLHPRKLGESLSLPVTPTTSRQYRFLRTTSKTYPQLRDPATDADLPDFPPSYKDLVWRTLIGLDRYYILLLISWFTGEWLG